MVIWRLMESELERSCNFEELSCEIGEYLRAARGEVNIIFYTDSSPTRSVNSWLDRDHGALIKERFDGLGQSGGLVDLKAQPVTKTVPERLAVPLLLDVATGETVRFLPFHSRADGFRSDGVGVPHDVVDCPLL